MRLLRNLLWGVAWGTSVALVFSLWVALLHRLRGPTLLEKYDLALLDVVAGYFLAGGAGGVMLGLLRPIAKGRVKTAMVGAAVGLLVYPVAFLYWGDWMLEGNVTARWLMVAVIAVLVGGTVGWAIWPTIKESENPFYWRIKEREDKKALIAAAERFIWAVSTHQWRAIEEVTTGSQALDWARRFFGTRSPVSGSAPSIEIHWAARDVAVVQLEIEEHLSNGRSKTRRVQLELRCRKGVWRVHTAAALRANRE